jgi:hypothetical protein
MVTVLLVIFALRVVHRLYPEGSRSIGWVITVVGIVGCVAVGAAIPIAGLTPGESIPALALSVYLVVYATVIFGKAPRLLALAIEGQPWKPTGSSLLLVMGIAIAGLVILAVLSILAAMNG